MTPEVMAEIHARALPEGRAWSADEMADLSRTPGFACHHDHGFALGRAIAGEAELIMLAVDPVYQGHGHGRALLADFESTAASKGAERLFLEVAADNHGALALYDSMGWTRVGVRKAYYKRATPPKIDALLYEKTLVGLA